MPNITTSMRKCSLFFDGLVRYELDEKNQRNSGFFVPVVRSFILQDESCTAYYKFIFAINQKFNFLKL